MRAQRQRPGYCRFVEMRYQPERALTQTKRIPIRGGIYRRNEVSAREGIDTILSIAVSLDPDTVEMRYQPERALTRYTSWYLMHCVVM